MTMAKKDQPGLEGLRVFPPPAKGFDALTAKKRELTHHGLPQRPDPRTDPELALLWEQRARRYKSFEHLEPKLIPPDVAPPPLTEAFTLSTFVSAGFELTSLSAPITMLSGTWTVPNLTYTPNIGNPIDFRTFFGLGFLDAHVEMTVDSAQNVSTLVRIHTGAQVSLPVRPGDLMSAVLCLQTNAEGTAFYGLVNETTSQTVNFAFDTHFPPAVICNAGITRGSHFGGRPDPLARFGAVYFDELLAWTTNGVKHLTNGVATSMVDSSGETLATPQRLNDLAFKVVYTGD
jgi:hypothetical protein